MTKLAWCTDVHFDSLDRTYGDKQLVEFGEKLVKDRPDGILVTGDISVSRALTYHLSALERVVQRPVYFVLGNHDFYGSSVLSVRKEMKDVSNMSQYLKYLPTTPYVTLSPASCLIGHDGWYDAGYGDIKQTTFMMHDWLRIAEFANDSAIVNRMPNYVKIASIAKMLAHEGVTHVMNAIKAAVKYHKVLVIATHFPPFEEAHIHNGRIGDPGAQPWYGSRMMGDMLRQAADAYPKVRFEVFCGHTHGKCDVQVAGNLFCHVGGAEYGSPQLAQLINVP